MKNSLTNMDLRNSKTNNLYPPAKAGGDAIFNFPISNKNCLKKLIHELPPALAGDNK